MRSILDILSRRRAANHAAAGEDGGDQLAPKRVKQLRKLELRLGYSFQKPILLEAALTHRSFAYEQQVADGDKKLPRDYESLEFLGDSVLGLVIAEYLFINFPTLPEGELSKMKSYLVSTNHLAKLSLDLGLGDFLLLSYGEEKTGGRNKRAILADLFESLTAAIYVDGGLDAARRFLLDRFSAPLAQLARQDLDFRDYKSRLQETVHRLGFAEPGYTVVEEAGPPHRREFRVEVRIDGRCLAAGDGRSKKEAQQKAARLALEQLLQEADG
jgi:ribonuclease III